MGEDLPPEAWGAISAIGVALVGVLVEVVHRRQRTEADKRQKEMRELIGPVSNGFAEGVKGKLDQVLNELQGVKSDMTEVKGSQVDLHRRLDSHLEDHMPKQRRRRR